MAEKQSRALEDATEWKLNPALFHKIVEKFGKLDIYHFTTRINKELDRYSALASRNQRQWLEVPSLLPGTTMISTCSTFQSCRLNISDDLQWQDKCNDGCTRLVNPYWYLQLLQMTNQDLMYFWLSLRNLTLPHITSKYHLLCTKKTHS